LVLNLHRLVAVLTEIAALAANLPIGLGAATVVAMGLRWRMLT
jgi:hypothetical protein